MSVTLRYILIAEIYISFSSDTLFFMFATPSTASFQIADCNSQVSHKISSD